ncbi:MAG: S-layer homology domain-containing protein, partial [Candidatus Peribacteraceae bacterium]|nr:S-layer homology domain-containing protein [Candidatus Peribacteraceae bacterium]
MRHLTVTIVLLFLTAIPLQSFGQTGATVTLLDSDGDGLTDAMEDTNGNGLVDTGETDPFDADTDGGGEADGAEVAAGRDPFDRKDDFTYDLDGDGLVNGEEWKLGTNPANPDSDNDGINDKDDPFPLNGAYRTDENENGIPDEYEESLRQAGAEPLQPSGDDDQDGLTNEQEFAANSDPFNADTDDDGVVDGMEVELGTDPTVNVCLLYGDAAVVFADLQDHWAEADVLALHRTFAESGTLRIVDGYRTASGALFLPDRSITRFELLKLALVSNCTAVTAQHDAENTVFSDVPYVLRRNASPAQLFRRNVIYSAARTGIIEGYPDGSVRPDDPVNRGE